MCKMGASPRERKAQNSCHRSTRNGSRESDKLAAAGSEAERSIRPRHCLVPRAVANLLPREGGHIDQIDLLARRFEAIVESSDDAIISKSLDGIITSWNPAAQRLFGYLPEEIIGRPISVLMPEERYDDMDAILGRIRRGERVEHYETVRLSKEGRRIQVSLSVSPVKDASGRIIGAAKIARDITGRKAAEEERERLLREAQQGVQLRDVFLSVAGHELRTPLNALKLQLYGLEQTPLTEKQRSVVTRAQLEVDRLTALTNRLLDVARMAAGGFTLEPVPMDLATLAGEVVARLHEDAQSVGSSVRLSTSPAPGRWDPSMLDQVVTNLLTNAIKFGRGEPIDVSVAVDRGLTWLRVRDHGPGVPSADRDRIFERFERGVSDRSFAGLGLGLWIAREIVEAHRGRIGVESPEGGGAEFFVALPNVEGAELARLDR
jgi:PAS domain S-box-containing protein